MHFSLFGIHVTVAAHIFRRKYQFWHDCNVTDCPARQPADETKFVIANRIVGSYSERFDTREDVERALKYFAPVSGSTSKRFEILESTKIHDSWYIGDPTLPPDQVFFVSDSAISK